VSGILCGSSPPKIWSGAATLFGGKGSLKKKLHLHVSPGKGVWIPAWPAVNRKNWYLRTKRRLTLVAHVHVLCSSKKKRANICLLGGGKKRHRAANTLSRGKKSVVSKGVQKRSYSSTGAHFYVKHYAPATGIRRHKVQKYALHGQKGSSPPKFKEGRRRDGLCNQ